MAAIALAFALTPAFAQNTASIPSATVNAGETVVEFRAGYGANDGGAADIYSQRIHVNYAPTGDLRLIAFIEQRRSSDGRDVFRRLSPNAFTQFVQTERWDLAVRRQDDIPLEDGVPGRLRLGLLNTWRFGNVELPSNVYFGREIGENAPDGFLFEMRAAAALRISPSLQNGAQVFNNFISSKTFGDFDRQRHQAGPFVRARIGKSLRFEARGYFSASRPLRPTLNRDYSPDTPSEHLGRNACATSSIRYRNVTKGSTIGLSPARTLCGTHSMRKFAAAIVFSFAVFCVSSGAALAQSTSAVSGSEVTAGEHLFDYRFAYSPENDGGDEGFVHRFHYQHGFTERLRGRALLTFGKRGAEPLKARFASLEALYQFKERDGRSGWDSAIRLDGNIPLEADKPGRGRVAWHNQYRLENGVELRGVLLVGREFGDRARPGASIETREEATYKLKSGLRVGAQMFNVYGTTADFGSFDEQRHQIGPVVKGKIGKHLRYEASTLFGVSKAASDADFRLFVSYAF